MYQRDGQLARAKSLYIKAIRLQEKLYGRIHPNYASSLNNLGNVEKISGNFTAAKKLYEESRRIHGETIGKKSATYALLTAT